IIRHCRNLSRWNSHRDCMGRADADREPGTRTTACRRPASVSRVVFDPAQTTPPASFPESLGLCGRYTTQMTPRFAEQSAELFIHTKAVEFTALHDDWLFKIVARAEDLRSLSRGRARTVCRAGFSKAVCAGLEISSLEDAFDDAWRRVEQGKAPWASE